MRIGFWTSGLSLLLASALLVACTESTPLSQDQVDELIENKRYREAIIQLKGQLQSNPNDRQARWLLGNVYLSTEDGSSAEKEFAAARRLGVSEDSVLPLLAQSLIMQGKMEEVLEIRAETSLSAISSGDLDASQALAKFQLDDDPAADALLSRALTNSPHSPWVKIVQSQILMARGENEGAGEILRALVASQPENGAAWSLLASVLRDQGLSEEAEKAYSAAIRNRPLPLKDRFNRGLVRLALDNISGAKEDADFLLSTAPKSPDTHYLNGVLDFQQENYSDSIDSLELAYTANPSHAPTQAMLALAHLHSGGVERADSIIASATASAALTPVMQKLKAVSTLSAGDTANTQRLLVPILNEAHNRVLVARTEPVKATATAEPAAGTGTSKYADPAEKLAAQRQVMKLLTSGDTDAAMNLVTELRDNTAKEATTENLFGFVLLTRGDKDAAGRAFERALEIEPGFPPASRNLALLALQNGDQEGAMRILDTSLAQHPEDASVLILAAEIDAKTGRVDSARRRLETAIVSAPNATAPRIALARVELLQGQASEAAKLLASVKNANQNNAEFLLLLGNAQLQSGNADDAVSTFEQLTDIEPNSPAGHFWLAKSFADSGDLRRMRSALERSLSLRPDYLPAKSAMIGLLIKENNLSQAEAMLAELKAQNPQGRELPLFSARLAMAKGMADEALKQFGLAASADPKNWLIRLEQSQAEWAAGNEEAALQIIENWLQDNPKDPRALLAWGELAINNKSLDKAETAYRRLIEVQPSNIIGLHNLAWLLSQHDAKQAGIYAERAVSVAPDEPGVLGLAADIALKNGRADDAVTLYQKAVDGSGGKAEFVIGLAKAEATNGNPGPAIAALRLLLSDNQDIPERAMVEQMIRDLESRR